MMNKWSPRVGIAREYAAKPHARAARFMTRGPRRLLNRNREMFQAAQVLKHLGPLQAMAIALEKGRSGHGTFTVQSLKRSGQWERLSSLKGAVLNELKYQKSEIARLYEPLVTRLEE